MNSKLDEKEENKTPTKEDLIKNNRESRLSKNWAHICPLCNRKYTTHNGINTHLKEYHKHPAYTK